MPTKKKKIVQVKKKWKDTKKWYWVLFIIAAFLMFLDGMVTTPIALVCVDGAYEANIWHRYWSDSLGVQYFFYSTPITVLFLFLLSQGVEKISYEWLKKHPHQLHRYHWPAYALFIVTILLFGSVVVSNFGVISHGI
jgi:membrane-anchored glycerophosphoryl diester phosphodiesterase (GDPDase)